MVADKLFFPFLSFVMLMGGHLGERRTVSKNFGGFFPAEKHPREI
jgi:hypothetical protein